MVGMIRVEDGVGDYHVSRIRRASDDLPGDAVITVVHGNREEDAPEAYTKKLEGVAAEIAGRIQEVRGFTARNADALADAVRLLVERNQMSADEARRMTALIDEVGTGVPTPAAQPATPTPAASVGSASNADASRSGFGE
ncbi:hypothetical protein C1632_09485 [Microbacterium testaceum]|nr:hypothetical protein C1632_09485 [Microbacterium testaceum]